MKISNSLFYTLSLIFILNLFSINISAQFFNDCQNTQISGEYIFVKDSDGKTPKDDAVITLILSGKSASINAKMSETEFISQGRFYACNNIISISFNNFNFSADKKSFSQSGNKLKLPFKIFGDNNGFSTWMKIATVNNNTSDSFSDAISELGSSGNNEKYSLDSFENTSESEDEGDDEDENENESENENDDNNSQDENQNGNDESNEETENNDNINKYEGDYIGTGWGWEVRFKHTSGDFVSQFSGVKKDELPFEGDKIIMSLLVEHATKYKIHIDKNNQVTGEGEIVYNVIPNLCGLAVLTEQVNSAVNLMGEVIFFFDLGKDIAKASVKSFKGKFLGMQGNLAKNAKIANSTGGKLINEYIGMKLPEKMKALDLEGQQGNALCNCAAGQAAISAGNKVGPSTIKEMIKTMGPDVAKALFMDIATGNLPVGMILSLPGVTQIQYEYKGLQHGPETRKFKIKGYLADGQLYLQKDGNVFGGSKDLTIEYTVNYKTERPTFPTWSPFLKNAGNMHPAGSEATIYEQVTKTKTHTFKDAATGKNKTMQVPYTETIEKNEVLPFPFATFREAGKQRNNVKVWHEYEYNWSIFKIPN